ncbi:MAG: teichoic acid D-Ala incorporation-associated protein DltX [Chloroflexi bacterium]|nr:teichoic acid D-Ala incorporation-associated protein DltX [Chloroflexota bacterium]MCL4546090.1 teichoic acid D-Ala incorporation-associated protein DltX [Chloroflexota bacterium]
MQRAADRDRRSWPVTWVWLQRPWRRLAGIAVVRVLGLTVYYLLLIAVIIVLYGNTTYTPPPFIYQGF